MVIGICDDEPRVRSQIETIVKEQCPQQNTKQFSNGIALINYIQDGGEIDILFLDIDFRDEMDGMESAIAIREKKKKEGMGLFALPVIIFVTGFPERMKEAFDVRALDFLTKPVEKDELKRVLLRAIDEAGEIHSEHKRSKTLELQINGRTILVSAANIVYMESMGRKVLLHTKERDIYCYGKLTDLLLELGAGFCRIHRSYIINLSFVEDYSRTDVIMCDGTTVPMSKDKYRMFIDAYLSFGSCL